MLSLIWAQARDATGRGVIGANGEIPWRVPEDFAHFKARTSGHPIIMGSRTWESLPRRPLPGRTNIVLDRRGDVLCGDDALDRRGDALRADALARRGDALKQAVLAASGVIVVPSIPAALEAAANAPGRDTAWVIGGGEVYRQTIDIADQLVVTEIDLVVQGDAYAPEIAPSRWELSEQSPWHTAQNGIRYRFQTYRTRGSADVMDRSATQSRQAW